MIACGRCAEHGLWLEHGTRGDFERVYAEQIEQHARARRLRDTGPDGEREQAQRIEALEARVGELERLMAELTTRVHSKLTSD